MRNPKLCHKLRAGRLPTLDLEILDWRFFVKMVQGYISKTFIDLLLKGTKKQKPEERSPIYIYINRMKSYISKYVGSVFDLKKHLTEFCQKKFKEGSPIVVIH